jgi:hypothetical protein
MHRLEVSCAVRPIYGSLGAKGLMNAVLEVKFMFSRRVPKTDKYKNKVTALFFL